MKPDFIIKRKKSVRRLIPEAPFSPSSFSSLLKSFVSDQTGASTPSQVKRHQQYPLPDSIEELHFLKVKIREKERRILRQQEVKSPRGLPDGEENLFV